MAIEIPKNIVSDHVVFDRIVDADRTIRLAREAAEEAAAAGKQDVADMLNAKADALEKILLATQQPDYEDDFAAKTEKYIVQSGDTIEKILIRFYGQYSKTSEYNVMQANNLSNPNKLSIGQELIIPIQ